MQFKPTPTLALALLALLASPVAFADHHETGAGTEEALAPVAPMAPMAPTNAFGVDLLSDLQRVEKKMLSLADAIPADKYGWAPTPEVRNTAASFVHVAQSNYQLLGALGVEAPEGVGDMEASITEKQAVREALEGSFAAVKLAVKETSDQDLDTKVAFFGGEWSKRQILMLVAGHGHEHLGQAIVYARSMGVVPPWSQPRDDS